MAFRAALRIWRAGRKSLEALALNVGMVWVWVQTRQCGFMMVYEHPKIDHSVQMWYVSVYISVLTHQWLISDRSAQTPGCFQVRWM